MKNTAYTTYKTNTPAEDLIKDYLLKGGNVEECKPDYGIARRAIKVKATSVSDSRNTRNYSSHH